MGLISASGSLSRSIGPLMVGWIYNEYGTYWTFGFSLIATGVALILLLVSYRRLIPYHMYLEKTRPPANSVEIEVTKF